MEQFSGCRIPGCFIDLRPGQEDLHRVIYINDKPQYMYAHYNQNLLNHDLVKKIYVKCPRSKMSMHNRNWVSTQ